MINILKLYVLIGSLFFKNFKIDISNTIELNSPKSKILIVGKFEKPFDKPTEQKQSTLISVGNSNNYKFKLSNQDSIQKINEYIEILKNEVKHLENSKIKDIIQSKLNPENKTLKIDALLNKLLEAQILYKIEQNNQQNLIINTTLSTANQIKNDLESAGFKLEKSRTDRDIYAPWDYNNLNIFNIIIALFLLFYILKNSFTLIRYIFLIALIVVICILTNITINTAITKIYLINVNEFLSI